MLLLSSAAIGDPVPEQPFLPIYWVNGTIAFPEGEILDPPLFLNNRIVSFSKEGSEGEVLAITDVDGNFSFNAYDLFYYYSVPINFVDTYKLAVNQQDDWGNDGIEITLDPTKGYKIITDPIVLAYGEGPASDETRVDVTIFLEGFYNPETQTQVQTQVMVEARTVLEGTLPEDDKAFNAYEVIDTALVVLGNNGVGTGYFEALPDGDYYLSVKHKLSDIPAGANHLPIITTNKYTLNKGDVVELDFNSIELYKPDGKKDPMTIRGEVKVMRGANADAEDVKGKIDKVNSDDVLILQNNWRKDPIPDIRADFNGDGKVNSDDVLILQNEWRKESYIPVKEEE